MSLRTPLGRVLGLGSARDGTEHWWAQRVSAVALALLGLWFAGSLAGLEGFAHAQVIPFIADPLNSVLLVLFCLTLAYHSHLGVQVVIEDYVHAGAVKVSALVLSRFAHVFIAVLSVYAVLRIGLGA
jgi:succinate dehydrogenase / fumarate reductase membrane anchor subunit